MASLASDELRAALRWDPKIYSDDTNIRANYLLPGDKGFLLPDLLRLLQEAELGLVCLVDYADWDPTLLFKDRAMPAWLQAELDKLSPAEQNHFYELIYPNHRLIDFWAEHPGSSLVLPWSDADWLEGRVQLNPILMDNAEFRHNFAQAHDKKLEFVMNWPGASRGRLTIPAPRWPGWDPCCRGQWRWLAWSSRRPKPIGSTRKRPRSRCSPTWQGWSRFCL